MGKPLIHFGTFGIHLEKAPSGNFTFVGEVPCDASGKSFKTKADGIKWLAEWVRQVESVELKRELVTNASSDLFCLILDPTFDIENGDMGIFA